MTKPSMLDKASYQMLLPLGQMISQVPSLLECHITECGQSEVLLGYRGPGTSAFHSEIPPRCSPLTTYPLKQNRHNLKNSFSSKQSIGCNVQWREDYFLRSIIIGHYIATYKNMYVVKSNSEDIKRDFVLTYQ